MQHTTGSAKLSDKALIESLPDDVSWEDVQHHLYVRQQIEAGLEDEFAGRLIDTDEMRQLLINHKKNRKGKFDELNELHPAWQFGACRANLGHTFLL